ncbi:MAG: hypothetical protein ACLPWS_02810 [Rhodomicrobium sp.]
MGDAKMRTFVVFIACIAFMSLGVLLIGYSSCNEPPKQASESNHTTQTNINYCTSPNAAFKIGLSELWTFVHGHHEEVIAVGTFFIAIFTVVLGLFTVSLATSTNKMARAAENTERRQLRAYVGMHEIETELPNLHQLNYEIPDNIPPGFIHQDFVTATIKNFGQTPAQDVMTVVNWQPIIPFGAWLPDDFGYRDQDTLNTIASAGRSVVDRDSTHFSTVNLNTLRAFRDAENKTCSLYLYGHIDYTDVYDRRWRREFCYIWEPWRPSGARFVPYREHNREYQIERNDPGIFPAP